MSEDQMALLKSSFMELSVLRLSYRFCVISLRFVAFNVVENYFLLIRLLFSDDSDDWKRCLWSDSLQEFTWFI